MTCAQWGGKGAHNVFNGRGALKQFAGLEAGPLCGRGLWTGSWRRDTKELSWGWGQRRSLSRWGVTEHQKTEGVRAHRSQRDQRSIAGGGGGGRIGVVGAAVLTSSARSWEIQSAHPWVGREGDVPSGPRPPSPGSLWFVASHRRSPTDLIPDSPRLRHT